MASILQVDYSYGGKALQLEVHKVLPRKVPGSKTFDGHI